MKTYIYDHNVDTDVIIPARYLNAPTPAEMVPHCMEDIDPEFAKTVQPGDIIVAGDNFGCGSSREHAPMAILASGVNVVIAGSFARIFYRNALNIGLLLMECPEASEAIRGGAALESVSKDGAIIAGGQTYQAQPIPEFVQNMMADGGLLASIGKRGRL